MFQLTAKSHPFIRAKGGKRENQPFRLRIELEEGENQPFPQAFFIGAGSVWRLPVIQALLHQGNPGFDRGRIPLVSPACFSSPAGLFPLARLLF